MKKERNSRHRGRTSRSEMPVRAVFRSAAMVLAAAVLSAMSAFAQESVSEVATEAAMEAEEEASRPVYRALDYVELGQYTGLPVSVEPVTVTEDDIEQAISDAMAAAEAYDLLTEGTVEAGDIANIDFEGKKDGVAFEGGTAQDFDLDIGSGMFIDGFEEGLIGVSIGDSVDLNLTFPENYVAENLAGQDVVFTVKVNSVKRAPEITDALVSRISAGAHTDLEEYREYLKTQLAAEKEEARSNDIINDLTAQLYNTCVIKDYPQDLVDYSAKQMKDYYTGMAEAYGVEFPDFLETYFGMNEEEFNSEAEEAVKDTLREELILIAICEQENLEVTEEEFDAGCQSFADQLGYGSVEDFLLDYEDEQILLSLRMEKAMSFVREHAEYNN